jgi:hypothetical protein
MADLRLTAHAQTRLAQRSIPASAVALVSFLGIDVEGGFMMRRKDAEEVASRLERVAKQIRQCAGLRVVADGGTVVTAYRPAARRRRRLIRTAYERDLEIAP